MLWFFLFIAWISVLFGVIRDLFGDVEASGWTKALWMIFIIVIPWLGVLVYLIVRGRGMAERRAAEVKAAEEAARVYIRDAAGTPSVADELAKLAELRDAGTITEDEFQGQKASLLA